MNRQSRRGGLSAWCTDEVLGFGAEVSGERAWRDRLDRVAIYDRVLTDSEVRENFQAVAGD